MSSTKPPCAVCSTPSITRCSACKVIHYCSSACQRKDWPRHKLACTPAGKPAPSPPPTTASSSSSSTAAKGSTASKPKIPVDPSKPIKLTPVTHDPSSDLKAAPLNSSTKLKFKFEHSHDGIDLNLLIFFHGLGDKIEPNFVQLAKSLNLPQTATVCIQAPTAVPFLEEAGWQWFPSFNIMTGELLGPEHKERITQVKQVVRPELVKFVKHCIDHCKFPSENIMLFGFSQGAQIALDLAAFGGLQLRGVVSIAGYMMEESENDAPALAKTQTKVMVMQGDKDDMRTVKEAKEKIKHLERLFGQENVQQLIVDGMGHGMPNSEAGWRPLMEFFAINLHHRAIAMEKMSDVYEVK